MSVQTPSETRLESRSQATSQSAPQSAPNAIAGTDRRVNSTPVDTSTAVDTTGVGASPVVSSVPAGWRGSMPRALGAQKEKLVVPVVIAAGIWLWSLLVNWQGYPVFILPGPAVVWRKFLAVWGDGTLMRHASATLTEIGLGLLLGLSTAMLLGYVLGKSRTVERLLAPYIVASQSVPIVALAPLLVIWFGSGMLSKVLVCALITFFPTLVSTIVGLRTVDEDLRDLMRSLRASRWRVFWLLELPSALPVLFGGLKLSVILAVVGAVVGEFVGADVGLGFLINLARGVLDTPLLFVALFSLIVIAQVLYLTVAALEHYCLRWQR